MAEIKSFEEHKKTHDPQGYKEKIRKHKMTIAYRIGIVVIVVILVLIVMVVQAQRHIYTSYDIVGMVDREKAADATDIRFQNSVLTYSKDGAHCTNTKGTVTWNQTYEISDIEMARNQNVVAIGEYNGRNIYVQNTEKVLGEIKTNIPIKKMAVSATGMVSVVMEDTDVTYMNTYNSSGEMVYNGKYRMSESGYPVALSLSPNGELLAVSFLYVEAGSVKTKIGFINFGPVGANQNDYMVSNYYYENLVTPEIHFMNDDTAFAVGDSRLMIYSGNQVPESVAERLLDQEIQSVYYNEKYIGLVFYSEDIDHIYKMVVYNTSGMPVTEYYFDIDYTDVMFEQDDFVIYNANQCEVVAYNGTCKFKGDFMRSVNLMLPTSGKFKYILVMDDTMETIQLK